MVEESCDSAETMAKPESSPIPVKHTILQALRICYKNPGLFLIPALIATLPAIISTVYTLSLSYRGVSTSQSYLLISYSLVILSIILYAYFQGIIPILTVRVIGNNPLNPMGAVSIVNRRRLFFSILLVQLLVALNIFVGLLLLIIPGILFGIFYMLSFPALVVGNQKGNQALRESYSIIKPVLFKGAFQIAVILYLPEVITTILSYLPRYITNSYISYSRVATAIYIAIYAVEIFWRPVVSIAATIIYLEKIGGISEVPSDLIYE